MAASRQPRHTALPLQSQPENHKWTSDEQPGAAILEKNKACGITGLHIKGESRLTRPEKESPVKKTARWPLGALLKKDLRQAVYGGSLVQACLLSLLCIFLFGMGLHTAWPQPGTALTAPELAAPLPEQPPLFDIPVLQACLFCLTSFLATAIVLPDLYRHERNCLASILALGLHPGYIWFSKALACFLLLPLCQAACFVAVMLFAGNAPLLSAPAAPGLIPLAAVPACLAGLVLFNSGLACLASLLSPLGQTCGRTLPLLLIPLFAPLLLKGAGIFQALLFRGTCTQEAFLPSAAAGAASLPPEQMEGVLQLLEQDLLFLLGFDLIIAAAALLLFPILLEGNEL